MSDNDRFEKGETQKTPLQEQVLEEFVDVADSGLAGRERTGEPNDTLPKPLGY